MRKPVIPVIDPFLASKTYDKTKNRFVITCHSCHNPLLETFGGFWMKNKLTPEQWDEVIDSLNMSVVYFDTALSLLSGNIPTDELDKVNTLGINLRNFRANVKDIKNRGK